MHLKSFQVKTANNNFEIKVILDSGFSVSTKRSSLPRQVHQAYKDLCEAITAHIHGEPYSISFTTEYKGDQMFLKVTCKDASQGHVEDRSIGKVPAYYTVGADMDALWKQEGSESKKLYADRDHGNKINEAHTRMEEVVEKFWDHLVKVEESSQTSIEFVDSNGDVFEKEVIESMIEDSF